MILRGSVGLIGPHQEQVKSLSPLFLRPPCLGSCNEQYVESWAIVITLLFPVLDCFFKRLTMSCFCFAFYRLPCGKRL